MELSPVGYWIKVARSRNQPEIHGNLLKYINFNSSKHVLYIYIQTKIQLVILHLKFILRHIDTTMDGEAFKGHKT